MWTLYSKNSNRMTYKRMITSKGKQLHSPLNTNSFLSMRKSSQYAFLIIKELLTLTNDTKRVSITCKLLVCLIALKSELLDWCNCTAKTVSAKCLARKFSSRIRSWTDKGLKMNENWILRSEETQTWAMIKMADFAILPNRSIILVNELRHILRMLYTYNSKSICVSIISRIKSCSK